MELYIHIPFCKQKCRYCDFLSFAGKESCFKEYIDALIRELEGYLGKVKEKGLDTIFIGGGTPSLLPTDIAEPLLEAVDRLILTGGGRVGEYTIECNPGTLSAEKLRLYRRHGVNRLSMGLQSADDTELQILGRIHDYRGFLDNYRLARSEGFDNINIDLISGLPGQSCADWEKTLRTVAELEPEHISAYSLIIEPGTPFYEVYGKDRNELSKPKRNIPEETVESADECVKIRNRITGAEKENMNILPLPDEDEERRIYHDTGRILAEYGYTGYEISNYSRPGYESKHNLGYWTGEEYIGAGLGASSYYVIGNEHAIRCRNTDDLSSYLKGAEPELVEELDKNGLIDEYIILHLRLKKGFMISEFREKFGIDVKSLFNNIIEKHIGLGLLEEYDGYIRLTDAGIDVSNAVMADFMRDRTCMDK